MYKLIISNLFFILLLVSTAKADIGNFDIVTFASANKTYHIMYDSPGLLNEKNKTYWNQKTKVNYSVSDLLDRYFKSKDVKVFEKLDVINLKKVKVDIIFKKKLFILREDTIINYDDLRKKYKIISAQRGNTYGYTYTNELNELDNHWLENYPIELLFITSDFSMCDMSFLGIENNLTKEEIEKLKTKINSLLKSESSKDFDKILSELYKRNIIMIGHCSC